ncbi:MAG: outer membrane protein assembly factor BamC [Thiohalophilus sp.]|jgi:outer membrane protein assembly factor BamC
MKRRVGSELMILVLVALLAGCSSSPEKDYRAIYSGQIEEPEQGLEVPPGLGKPRVGEQMQIPAIGRERASYSSQQNGDNGQGVLATAENIRFVRQGNMHWLELDMPPAQVWSAARDFLKSLGFEITREDPALGVMETDWQERRERIPGNWLQRVMDSISSTGFRDRYMVRLERMPQGGTRLFISHRGLQEVVSGGDTALDITETAWVPTEPDTELEVELLKRFLISLGTAQDQATRIVAGGGSSQPVKRAQLVEEQGEPVLQVHETFPRTWRRVGLALDRVGVLVEDRNRSEGLYYIKLTDEFMAKEQKGFWASFLEDKEKKAAIQQLLLKVDQQGEITLLRLRDRNNGTIDPTLAKRLLEDMEVHLR